MTRFYPNGIGGTLGDSLATASPLQTSGQIWYVDSQTGSDSYTGSERERPFATASQAMTSAASDDIIVFLSGHTQTLTATQTVSKRLTFVGEGSSGGLPTVKFKMNAAAARVFRVQATNVELRNIWFQSNQVANTFPAVSVESTSFRAIGCYFELSATDNIGITLANCDNSRIESCTFVSTATSKASLPVGAIANATAVANLEMVGCVFNGGTAGFSGLAVDLSAGGAMTQFKGTNISLLNSADMKLNASSTGWLNVQTATGGGRVEW